MSEEWISIDERKPEQFQEVVVKGKFPFVCNVIYQEYEKGGYEFVKKLKQTNASIYGVTHWKKNT